MRIIELTLAEDGNVVNPYESTGGKTSIARQGEHNAVQIRAEIPPLMREKTTFFRMSFRSKSVLYVTGDLYPTGNTVIYTLPQSVLLEEGTLKWQISGYAPVDEEDGELSYTQIVRSVVVPFQVSESVDGILTPPKDVIESVDAAIGDVHALVTEVRRQLDAGELNGKDGAPGEENISKTKAVLSRMQQKQPVRIVCYGDSITYGYTIGSGMQVPNPYPKVLQQNLRDLYQNDSITVINAGHSGWQTDEALNGISEVINHAPDLCIFSFGINDAKGSVAGGTPLTLQQYRENTETIIQTLLAANIVPVVMTPTPISIHSNATDYQTGQTVQKQVMILEQLCKQYGLCLVDAYKEIQSFFNGNWVDLLTFSSDGIHFAPEGYRYLAHIILKDLCGIRVANAGDKVAATINFDDMVYDLAFKDNVFAGYKQQVFKNNILLRTANSSSSNRNGTAVKMFVYNRIPGMKARIHYPKATTGDTGASTGFRNNGVFYPADFYVASGYSDGDTDISLEFGLNQIEMRATDCTQTGTGGFYKNMFWGGTEFIDERVSNCDLSGYRHIATSRVTQEGLRSIVISQDKFGNPFALHHAKILVSVDDLSTLPAQGSGTAAFGLGVFINDVSDAVYITGSGLGTSWGIGTIRNKNYSTVADLSCHNRHINGIAPYSSIGTTSGGAPDTFGYDRVGLATLPRPEFDAIRNVEVFLSTSVHYYPIGAEIQIWGVTE